jgi:protein TonB
MIGFTAEDLADLRRWAISGAIVVFAYGGIAAAMVTWHEPIEGDGQAAAIVIEFAPMPVAPATLNTGLPPGPEQDFSDASPNKPVDSPEEKEKIEQKVEAKLERKVEETVESKPVEEPPPEVPPAPNPEVAIEPPPPREVKQETPQRQEPRVASVASAPQAIAEQTAAIPAAPTHGPPNPNRLAAEQSWNSQIAALLKRNLRYPPKAASRGEKGVVQISFSLDRQGRVIDSRVVHSSGVAMLDEEALALVRRVQPFPPPPPQVQGERVEKMAPIRFIMK